MSVSRYLDLCLCCAGGCVVEAWVTSPCTGQQDSAGRSSWAGQVSSIYSTHRQIQGTCIYSQDTHTQNMEHATITSYLKNRYYCYMYLLTICGCINGPVTSDTALLLDWITPKPVHHICANSKELCSMFADNSLQCHCCKMGK